ncbi:FecR domain-containing protein [Mesonia aquimarina]|uniref:FecR domain-containing protein n=1 Tax=Mesonia aquimarina TaxID=1504967 RepID=UPI000EF55E3F|nr:FecR domain-containing protein [Mesonia aquimarina]
MRKNHYPFIVFLSLFLMFITSSCSQTVKKGESKLIVEQNGKDYNFKIEESGLKLNPENEIQCSNYYSYKSNTETGFQINAGKLKRVISALTDIDEINISIEADTTYGKFFNIDYNGKITSESNEFILNKLLEYYKLEMIPTEKKVDVFMLGIIEPNKLNPIHNDKSIPIKSTLNRIENQFIFKNLPLNVLAKQLQNFYNQRFEYIDSNDKTYNLKIEMKNDLNKTVSFLEKEYGISISKKEIETTIYRVVKKD